MSNTPSELFSSGNILYVYNYDFGNSIPTRNKYLIVLHVSEDYAFILHSLTTSQIKVPPDKENHGCTNNEEIGLSFYMFEDGRVIGETKGFSFKKKTFVFFQVNVRKTLISHFDKYIKNNQIDFRDKLTNKEFKRLLKCAVKSFNTPRNLKSIIRKQIELLD